MNLGEFDGKTVLVTGAAQGIGSVVAKMFLERGATVIAVDQNEEGLNVLLNQNELNNTRMKTFRLDVSDSAAVEDMVNHIANEIAPIDILINVAGVLRMGPIHSLSDEDWNKTFSVNTTGVFNMSRAVSKNMMLRKSGAIVTVGSNAANTPRMEMAAYAASKAATTMFMKCLGL
ncbi:SDR family NAD(P)-dependent oxidoreductase, partial [Bacillus cereus]